MKLTEISTIKSLCRQFGFTFKKKYGQNFLVDEAVPRKIAALVAEKNVLEIGAGFGTLTDELAQVCKKVVAIEIDSSLQQLLQLTVGQHENVSISFADAMKVDLSAFCAENFDGEVAVCANLPYYITTPIILHLLESGVQFESITVMVQKEVADRLAANAGESEYGAITLACQRYGRVEKVFDVPRHSFYPSPNVDSSVITILPAERQSVYVKDEETLTKVIRAAFGQRRKTFVNAVSVLGTHSKAEIAEILVSCGFREDIRGERLTLADFAAIANKM